MARSVHGDPRRPLAVLSGRWPCLVAVTHDLKVVGIYATNIMHASDIRTFDLVDSEIWAGRNHCLGSGCMYLSELHHCVRKGCFSSVPLQVDGIDGWLFAMHRFYALQLPIRTGWDSGPDTSPLT